MYSSKNTSILNANLKISRKGTKSSKTRNEIIRNRVKVKTI